MSGITSPRLGTEPRLGENDRVSRVRFSSRRLSLSPTGTGSLVGDPRSGRKMVLKPLPWNTPAKAASGPRLGTDEALSLNVVWLDTSPNLKSAGWKRAGSRLISLIGFLPRLGSVGDAFGLTVTFGTERSTAHLIHPWPGGHRWPILDSWWGGVLPPSGRRWPRQRLMPLLLPSWPGS